MQICIGSVVHTACHYRNLWILANTPHFEGCGGVLREKDVPYDFGEYFRLMFVARCATARATLYVASRVASAAVLHQLLCCISCCVASAAGFSACVCLLLYSWGSTGHVMLLCLLLIVLTAIRKVITGNSH